MIVTGTGANLCCVYLNIIVDLNNLFSVNDSSILENSIKS